MDETTPHLHLVFVPIIHTKDENGNTTEKIACSEYWKGKDSYKKLQDSFYKYVTENGFNLERGKQRKIEHLSIEKLKQVTGYDNIKYEITQDEIKPLETQNKALILRQNQELIKYSNSLKSYLSRAYKSIEKIKKLQQENTNLAYENQNLKKENYRLKNYIENTFEVAKQLFNFPIDTFKRLVNNFINYYDK